MRDKPRILLTGGRAPATLDLARLFHRTGCMVFVADSCRSPIAKGSAAVHTTFHVCEPKSKRAAFIADLLDIIRKEAIDLLIPTCEEIFYIAQALPQLSAHCTVFADRFEKLAALHSKWTFAERLNKNPLPASAITAPETHLLENSEALTEWLAGGHGQARDSREWVFKPVFSRFAAHTRIQPNALQIQGIHKIMNSVPQAPWVAQRYIPGTEYSTYSIAKEGQLLAHVTYHSPYRAGKGSGIYFEPVAAPEILAFTQAFVKQWDYTGQIAFDFRQTSQGKIYVLECNPRATSGIHLFAPNDHLSEAFLNPEFSPEFSKGALPKNSALESPKPSEPETIRQPQVGTAKMLGLIMPLYGLQSGPSPLRFIRDMCRTPDAVFSWEDPMPFFYQFVSFAEIVRKSRRRKVSLTQAATADLEWDGD